MTQEECLNYLKEHKHGTAKDIANFYKFSPGAVQHNLQALKKNKYPVDFTIERLHEGKSATTYVWHYLG